MRKTREQRFKSMLFGMVLGVVIPTLAMGQAALLPNAKQQYLDDAGNPVSSGTVTYYVPGTSTKKSVWLNSTETTLSTNPVILDAAGHPQPTGQTFGDGVYRQVVKDQNNVVIWDAVTSSTGGGSGGGVTVGDGLRVGTVLPWAGLAAPNNYLFAYGQSLNRVTYSALFDAVTLNANVVCTVGLNVISGIADTQNIRIGAPIEATCLAPGTTVVSVSTTSVVVTNNATVSTAVLARFFPWGNGDGSTTFNVPDYRGRTPIGRNNMGGTASATLTDVFYGTNTSPNALGSPGGSQSRQFLQAYLPIGTFPVTVTGTATVTSTETNVIQGTISSSNASGGTSGQLSSPSTPNQATAIHSTGAVTGSGTAATGGSGQLFSIIGPGVTTNYIIKALPDVSLSVASCLQLSDAGTACQANTGTSGHAVPFLDGTNVWSGNQQFNGTVNGLTLVGSTNTVSIQATLGVANTAASFLANPTGSTGSTVSTTIQGLPSIASLDANLDFVVVWDHVTGAFRRANATQIGASSGGVAGVSSIGGVAGVVALGDGLSMSGTTLVESTPISTVTSTGAVTGSQKVVLCDATSGSIAITIPSPATVRNGTTITIKRKDAIAYNCFVVVSGGSVIDGLTNWPIEPQYASFTFVSDGSANWWVQ